MIFLSFSPMDISNAMLHFCLYTEMSAQKQILQFLSNTDGEGTLMLLQMMLTEKHYAPSGRDGVFLSLPR